MPRGITQCYLPPGRGDIPVLTPARLVLDLTTPEVLISLETEKGCSCVAEFKLVSN